MRRPFILLIALALTAAACGDDDATTPTTAAVVGGGSGGSGGGSVATTSTIPGPTTTTQPATTTTTRPPVDTGSQEAPLPPGTPVTIGNWEVTVLSSTTDATEAVLAANSFNEAPAGDYLFTMVRVATTYLGEGSESPLFGLTFGAIGDSGVVYGFEDDCGVTPDGLPSLTEVFPGGSVAGNLCWAVSYIDAGALVLTAEAAFSLSSEPFFLGVPPEGVSFEAPVSVGIVDDGGERGSRSNPTRAGQEALIGTWEISVLGSTPDATEAVLAENDFNAPPADGRQFLMVEIQATNRGIESETPFSALTFSAVGPSAVAYGFGDSCGVIPNSFPDFEEVFAGGTITGNLCWSVATADADALLLIVDASFTIDDVRTFFQIP
jgi:hypothetical protein